MFFLKVKCSLNIKINPKSNKINLVTATENLESSGIKVKKILKNFKYFLIK